ncbi:MAG: PfkB family carbohydrate kinase [Conexivisphaerales archaeon]|nr:PfkB family carbohydrate kinase [Conexivisphaerales archaeon]
MNSLVLASYNATFVARTKRMPAIGETIAAEEFRIEHGGKGSNQAIALQRLGCRTSIIASIGKDAFGDLAIKKWKEEGLNTNNVKFSEKGTGIAFVFLFPDSSNAIVIARNANEEINSEMVDRALERSSFDVFLTVFEVNPEIAMYAIKKAASKGKTVLNPAPAVRLSPEELDGITAITPNESEFKVMSGYSPEDKVDMEALADKYLNHVEVVAVTLGENGSFIATKQKKKIIPAYTTKPIDVTGAGDAWNAAFAYMIGKGEDPFYAAEFANAAGAFLVSRKRERKDLVENLPYESEVYEIMNESRRG